MYFVGISRNEGLKRLNSSVVEHKGLLQMDFGANKMPIEIIKEGAFGGTYFRDIQMLVKNGTKIHEKNLIS